MSTLRIVPADFADPRLAAFLQAHLDDIAPTAPACSQHALDLDGLRSPTVRLFVVLVATQDGDDLVATGALAGFSPGEEELKSMRTDPSRRGQGIGAMMLDHLVEDARSRGVQRLWLETGSMEFFAPARSLYAAAGFEQCPPFGSYRPDPNSMFFTKQL